MTRNTKIVKKIAALFLVLLLSIESFAAIVSDNDGSAFVTKGEFEALKSNFASQIKNYNDSIDGKIDGAVASYLSGIQLEKKDYVSSTLYKANSTKDVIFSNNWTPPLTQIGDKYQWGPFFWFEFFNVVKNDGVWVSAGSGQMRNNGVTSLAYRTAGTSNTWIVRPGLNKKYNKYYIDNESFWEILPRVTVISLYWHDSITSCAFEHSQAGDMNIALSYSDAFTNSNSAFGYKLISGQSVVSHAGAGYSLTSNAPAAYITETTDRKISIGGWTDGKYAHRLAGNLVTGTLKTTKDEDWGTTDVTPFASQDMFGVNGYRAIGALNNTTGVYVRYDMTNWMSGIPSDVKVYSKKNTDMNAIDLIHNGWSTATNEEIKYYTGIPLFTASSRGVVELDLAFTSTGADSTIASAGADFSIRNGKFLNSNTLDAKNVELYSDKNLDTSFTGTSFTGTSYNPTIYFEAKAGETYWIKVKPKSTNEVKINTKNEQLAVYQY